MIDELDLSNNKISNLGAQRIFEWLLEKKIIVRIIKLYQNRIGDYGMYFIAHYLGQQKNFSRQHYLGQQGVDHLEHGLGLGQGLGPGQGHGDKDRDRHWGPGHIVQIVHIRARSRGRGIFRVRVHDSTLHDVKRAHDLSIFCAVIPEVFFIYIDIYIYTHIYICVCAYLEEHVCASLSHSLFVYTYIYI